MNAPGHESRHAGSSTGPPSSTGSVVGSTKVRPVDEVIDECASRQHGVVARAQLLTAGVPVHAIDHRLRKRRLRPIHRGVYGLGRLRGPHAAEMAAVLAAGDGALLSYRSAAALWNQMPPRPAGAAVEVSTRSRHSNSRPGLKTYRLRRIRDDEATSLHGIPVTTRARTVLDLAAVLSARDLERAVARAVRDGLEAQEVLQLLARYPRRAGTPLLRSLLGEEGLVRTRSEAEEVFLAILERGGLPKPATNVRVRGLEVDCLFRSARLVVEIDGFSYHSSSVAFERDRSRDQILYLAGYDVLRFTWNQLDKQPDRVLAKVAAALATAETRRR